MKLRYPVQYVIGWPTFKASGVDIPDARFT